MLTPTKNQPGRWTGKDQTSQTASGKNETAALTRSNQAKTSLSSDRLSRRFQLAWAKADKRTSPRDRPLIIGEYTMEGSECGDATCNASRRALL